MLNCDIEFARNTKKSLNVKKKSLINIRFLKSESDNEFNVKIKKKKTKRRLTSFNNFDQ